LVIAHVEDHFKQAGHRSTGDPEFVHLSSVSSAAVISFRLLHQGSASSAAAGCLLSRPTWAKRLRS